MQNYVFVLNANKQPLLPIHPGKARLLLNQKKAAVIRRYPFTIILKEEVIQETKPVRVKLDPGSKVTGIALVQGDKVIWGAELIHRGQTIKDKLTSRRQLRRGRRNRKTRDCFVPRNQPRFENRKRREGWLAPSLQHRVDTTLTWVKRLIKLAPVDSIATELVKFDLQQA